MKPGSWLEVSNPLPEKLAAIWDQGYVEKFIVTEKAGAPPEFPFLLLVNDPVSIANSTWQNSQKFSGFLLRAEKLPANFELNRKTVWLELVVNDVSLATQELAKAVQLPLAGIFILAGSIGLKKLNRFIAKNGMNLTPRPHDLKDHNFSSWENLEKFEPPVLSKGIISSPVLSIVIPHFENPYFLSNVLSHLERAYEFSKNFEAIVIDDHSSEKTFDSIKHFIHRKMTNLPIRLCRWNDKGLIKKSEKIFRAGASRNWGATLAQAPNLFFLDADMLVPVDIANQVVRSLSQSDVVQFVRQHIPRSLSFETSQYQELLDSPKLYTEEATYWEPLFKCNQWSSLQDYWKYTCTYALAMKKETFFKAGRIRRNFISYGFEDTDLGYRLFQNNLKFELNKTPLLHLTATSERTQNIFFRVKKLMRIQDMAKVFYKLHLRPELYSQFQAFLD